MYPSSIKREACKGSRCAVMMQYKTKKDSMYSQLESKQKQKKISVSLKPELKKITVGRNDLTNDLLGNRSITLPLILLLRYILNDPFGFCFHSVTAC